MKKIIFLTMAVLAVFIAACGSPSNSSAPIDYSVFVFDETTNTITGYTGGPGVKITIPAAINEVPVLYIGENAFFAKSLTGVTIPNGVLAIQQTAFAQNNLTNVTIPNSVIYIREYAFLMNSLKSVTIGNSVIYIEKYAFARNDLTSVTIPSNVTIINYAAFSDNPLTSITIQGDNVSIGDSAFRQLSSGRDDLITKVTIGANATLYSTPYEPIGEGFEDAYNTTYSKAAGTYTRPNKDSTTWTKE